MIIQTLGSASFTPRRSNHAGQDGCESLDGRSTYPPMHALQPMFRLSRRNNTVDLWHVDDGSGKQHWFFEAAGNGAVTIRVSPGAARSVLIQQHAHTIHGVEPAIRLRTALPALCSALVLAWMDAVCWAVITNDRMRQLPVHRLHLMHIH